MTSIKRITKGIYESTDGKWLITNQEFDNGEWAVRKYNGKESELITNCKLFRDAKEFVNSQLENA